MNEYTNRDFADVEARYRRQVARAYGYLTLRGYPERDPRLSAVRLERIFIKLSTTTTPAPALEMPVLEGTHDLEASRERWRRGQRERPVSEGRELSGEELLQRYKRWMEEFFKPHTVTLSVPEALRDHDRLVVTGPPGSGKTTLLRWLALTFAEGKQAQPDRLGDAYPHERLPVLVELRRFHGRFVGEREQLTTVNLADEIAAFVAGDARFEGTPAEFIRRALANGECLVAFDGLDEIAEFTARQRASAALQAFADNYAARGNHIVITSRPAGYKGVELGPGFQCCEINPFTPEDISEFIHHWCEAAYYPDLATAREEADELVKAIEDNDRVAKLAETPLLCTIIAIVYRNSRILPNRRVELYLKCCEALLDTWERVKEIRQSGLIGGFDWQTKLELLSPLAYWLHSEEGRTAAPEAEFERRLAEDLRDRRLCEEPKAKQEARAFLSAIRERSGLLQGRGDGTLEFPHLTFQEYLAARHIAATPDMGNLLDMFMPHLHEAWWREVHLLTIGHLGSGRDGAPKATALLEAILDRYKPPLRFLQAFPYHGGPFGGLRNLLARAFPRWQLVRRLAWAMQRECFFAATALGDCAPLGVTNEGRDRVRVALEEVLLLATLHPYSLQYNPQYNPLLTPAASSLVKLGKASPELIGALVTTLRDSRRSVQEAAACSLVQLAQTNPEAIVGLVNTLLDDSDWRVQSVAARSLGRVVWKSSEVTAALVAALGDSDVFVGSMAAFSLGELGQASPEVIAALLATLDDSDVLVQSAAASGLGQLGQASPEVIAALIAALGNSDLFVHKAAARSLSQLGKVSPEAIAALVAALGDSRSWMRRASASSLGHLGQAGPEVIAALVATLDDSDKLVQSAVASSLVQLRQTNPEAIAVLLDDLSDSSMDVRRAAVYSLGKVEQTSSAMIAALVATLGDSENLVRLAAMSSLVQLGQTNLEVITAVMGALGNGNRNVREAGARSLGRLGQASLEVIAALMTALGDSESRVRQAAASSLVQLGQSDPEVIAVLFTALGDGDEHVRLEVVSSLVQLGQANQEALVALNRALHDSSPYVCYVVHKLLPQLLDGKPIPGEEWVPLEVRWERGGRLKRTIRRVAVVLLALAMALAPLAYVLAALYVPQVRDNQWFLSILLAGIAAWIAFLANVGKIRQTLGDLWR